MKKFCKLSVHVVDDNKFFISSDSNSFDIVICAGIADFFDATSDYKVFSLKREKEGILFILDKNFVKKIHNIKLLNLFINFLLSNNIHNFRISILNKKER